MSLGTGPAALPPQFPTVERLRGHCPHALGAAHGAVVSSWEEWGHMDVDIVRNGFTPTSCNRR